MTNQNASAAATVPASREAARRGVPFSGKKSGPAAGGWHWWISAGLVALVLAAGFLATKWVVRQADAQERAKLLAHANAIAHAINVDRVKALSFTAADLTVPEFQRLRSQMMACAQALDLHSLYMMALRDGQILFGPESFAATNLAASPPGTVYKRAAPEDFAAFTTGQPVVFGPVTDEYGTFISAMAPVLDPRTRKVLVVIGLDIEVKDWQAALAQARRVPIGFTVALLAVLLAGAWALEWRRRPGAEHGWRRQTEAILCAVIGMLLTAAGTWLAHEADSRSREQSFTAMAHAQADGVSQSLIHLRDRLELVGRFFRSDEQVDRDEFRAFVRPLVRDRLAQVWAWVPAVTNAAVAPVEDQARQDGETNFAVWEKDAAGRRQPVAGRAVYYPVLYVEPRAGNAVVLGFDNGSEPVRRAALETAARTVLPTATAPIRLLQYTNSASGLVVFHPVLARTNNQRQVLGFATVVLRADSLLSSLLARTGHQESDVSVELFQLAAGQPPQFLAASSTNEVRLHAAGKGFGKTNTGRLGLTVPVFLFGQAFALVVHAERSYWIGYPMWGRWLVGASGGLLTVLLTGFFALQGHRRLLLEEQVRERTAELELSERSYRRQFSENAAVMLLIAPEDGQILDANAAAARFYRYPLGKLLSLRMTDINLLPPEAVQEKLASVTAERGSVFEFFHLLAGGGVREVEECCSLIQFGGRPVLHSIITDVTERKVMQFRLRENEARQQAILTQITDVVAIMDKTGIIIYKSPNLAKWFGWAPMELLGMHCGTTAHPDDQERLGQAFAALLKSPGASVTIEYRYRCQDGSFRPVEATAVNLLHDPSIRGVLANYRDITRRRKAEGALRENERQLTALLGNLPGLAYRCRNDQDWTMLFVSVGCQALTGYTVEDFLVGPRITYNEIIHPDDRAAVWEKVQASLARRERYELEFRIITATGDEKWVWESGRGVFSEKGELETLEGIHLDVTQRRHAEMALRENERQLTALLGNLPGMAYRCRNDHDWTMFFASESCLALTGYTVEDLLTGRITYGELIHPDDRAGVWEKVQASLARRERYELQYRITTATGVEKWIWESGLGVFSERGELEALEGINFDITQRQVAETALRENERQLSALLGNLPGMAYRSLNDEHWTLKFVSVGCLELTGYTVEDLLENRRMSFGQLIHPDDQAAVWEKVQAGLAQRTNYHLEYRIITAAGVEKWVWESGLGVFSEMGELQTLEGLIIDITQRQIAETALRDTLDRSRRQQSALAQIAVAPALVAGEVATLAAQITELAAQVAGVERASVWLFNEAETELRCLDLYEVSPRRHSAGVVLHQAAFVNEFAALRTAKYVDAHDPLTDPRTIGYRASYLEPLHITSMLDAAIRMGGQNLGLLCLEHVNQPHHWAADEISFACQLGDQIAITLLNQRRRLAEAALRHEQELSDTIIDSIPGTFYLIDEHGHYARWNAYQRDEVSGLPEDQMTSMSAGNAVHPDDRALVLEKIEDVLSGGSVPEMVKSVEARVLLRGGPAFRWFLLTGRRIIISGRPFVLGTGTDITERRQAERSLRESEVRFRTLVENIPQKIFIKDRHLRFVACNENFARSFGALSRDLIGKSDYDFFPRDLAEQYRAEDERVMLAGQSETLENKILVDGREGWELVVKIPLRNEQGEVTGVFGSLWDITDRKKALEVAQRERAFSNAVIESIPGTFYVLDETGHYVRWNAYQRDEIVGLPEDQVANKNAADTIHPDDRALVSSRIANVLRDGKDESVEGRVLLRGGPASRWLLMTGRQIKIEGRPFLVGTGIDITERKQAEADLRESRDRIVKLAAQVPGVVYQYRLYPDGRSAFPFASPGMNDIYEVAPEEVREDATPVFGRLHPDDYGHVSDAIQESARTLQMFYCEFRVILPRQGMRWRWSQAQPERTEDGGTLWYGIVSDITERKQAEAALQQSQRLLAQTEKLGQVGGWEIDLATQNLIWTETVFHLHEVELSHQPSVAEAIQFYAPASRPVIVQAVQRAIEQGEPFDVELEIITARGNHRWAHSIGEVDRARGKVLGFFQDITERKQVTEALREREEKYRLLYDNTLDTIWTTDLAFNITYVNKAIEKFLGYGPEEFLGLNPVVFTQPDSMDTLRGAAEKLVGKFSQGDVSQEVVEVKQIKKDGTVIDAEVSANLLINGQGEVIGFSGRSIDITERKVAEAAIKEQGEQLQNLFDNAPVGIFHSTPKGRFLAVNPALARMLGHASPEELIAATADMTTQIYADPPRRSQIVHDLLGSDGWVHYDEVAWLRKDGRQITVDMTGRRVLNATGSFAYLEGFVEDITERQQAQKKLAAAAVFHLQILKNAPALIWRSGTDALCGWFNDTWLEFTGRTMEQEMGNGWAEGVHPEDFVRCLQIYQEAFAARRAFAMDYRLRHHSGEYRWISDYGTPFNDLSGSFGGFIGYCFDITERRQAEERINALVEMVNAAPLSILVHDFSGQLLYANPSTFALHQYSEPEFMALNLRALDVPESKALIQARMDQIVQTGQASFEVGHFRKDGSVVPLELLVKQVSWRGQPALLSIGRDITERRQTAAALAASEERHRLLLQYLPVGVVVHQADTAITLANAAASRLLGLTLDQLQGRVAIDPAWRFLRADEHPMPVDEYPVARVLATGRPLEGFVVGIYRPVSGDRVWVLVNAFPQLDAAGKVWQVEVTFIDITARKLAEEAALQAQARAQELLAMAEISAQQLRQAQAETEASLAQTRRANQSLLGVLEDNQAAHKALSEAKALLQTAMDCSPAGIAIADAPDGRLRYVNRAGLGIRGGSEAELVTGVDLNKYVASWQILDLNGLPLPPEEVPLTWAIQKGEPHSREFIIRRASNDDRIVLANAAPVLDAAGKVIAGIVVFVDITERKRAEAALRMGEARFQEFMSHLPAAVFIKDVFGRTIFANRYFQNLPAWQGKTMSQLLAGQGAQRMTEDDLRALVGKPVEAEEKLPAAAGADRVFKTIKFAILVPEQPAMLGGIALDITSLKDAEEEVRRLNQGLEQRVKDRTAQLEASNRELEAFSYSVSHDLRAPLRAINGYARLLHKGHASHLDAEGLRVLGVVSSEAQRMGTLIDDLLAFSRLGRQPVKRSTVNLQNLAKSVFADLAAAVPERALRLTLSADVPPVSADPALLRQVLVNLLGNAVKYTRPVTAPLIELGSRVEGEETIYFVRDNGVGFDMKYVGKLFGVFQRLHSEAEFEGTGVGLALAQRIIHRHGGRIWADSKLGEGAIFSFTLPLAKVEI